MSDIDVMNACPGIFLVDCCFSICMVPLSMYTSCFFPFHGPSFNLESGFGLCHNLTRGLLPIIISDPNEYAMPHGYQLLAAPWML